MKRLSYLFVVVFGYVIVGACDSRHSDGEVVVPEEQNVTEPAETAKERVPFSVAAPTPDKEIEIIGLDADDKELIESANSFAFNIMNAIYAESSQQNLVFSPLSIEYALGLLAGGVSGTAKDEIVALLGCKSDMTDFNELCRSLILGLPALDLDVIINLSNAIVVDEGLAISESYRETAEKMYYSCVENVPFSDSEKVTTLINSWCNKNTNGLIPEIIKEVSSDAVAYILNALYFKGLWKDQYEDFMVSKGEPFYGVNGTTAMNYLVDCVDYRYAAFDGFEVLEKPFSNEKYAYYIILPSEGKTVLQTIDALKESKWTDIQSSLKFKEVALKMPEFEVSSSLELNETLRAMGMNAVFAGGRFTMFDPAMDFFVSRILHEARISVSQAGTEAAAVTVVLMAGESPDAPEPLSFVANRPFVYLISEKTTGTILFSGVFAGK